MPLDELHPFNDAEIAISLPSVVCTFSTNCRIH